VGYPDLGFSQLATLYYKVPVRGTQGGVSVNPTGTPPQFAFMPQATQVPQSGDWVTGSWETIPNDLLFPYSARCLVGPGGAITLSTGIYVAYTKVTYAPETDVEIVGYLEIS
jgi:hypothetical protein